MFNEIVLYFNYNFSTKVCEDALVNQEKIGGPGKIVEIDETHVSSRPKNNSGRELVKKEHFWIFGGVERLDFERLKFKFFSHTKWPSTLTIYCTNLFVISYNT